MPITDPVRLAEIAIVQAQIAEVRLAISRIVNGAQNYSIDSGQTRQSVTRSSLGELRNMLVYLRGELRELQTEPGSGAIYVRPGF